MAPSFLEVVPSRNSSTFFFGNPQVFGSRMVNIGGSCGKSYPISREGDTSQRKNTNMGGLLWNTAKLDMADGFWFTACLQTSIIFNQMSPFCSIGGLWCPWIFLFKSIWESVSDLPIEPPSKTVRSRLELDMTRLPNQMAPSMPLLGWSL